LIRRQKVLIKEKKVFHLMEELLGTCGAEMLLLVGVEI